MKTVDVEAVLEGKNLESVTMRGVRRMLEKRLQLDEGSLEAEDQKEKVRKKVLKIIESALEAQLAQLGVGRSRQEVEELRLDEKERRKRKRLRQRLLWTCERLRRSRSRSRSDDEDNSSEHNDEVEEVEASRRAAKRTKCELVD